MTNFITLLSYIDILPRAWLFNFLIQLTNYSNKGWQQSKRWQVHNHVLAIANSISIIWNVSVIGTQVQVRDELLMASMRTLSFGSKNGRKPCQVCKTALNYLLENCLIIWGHGRGGGQLPKKLVHVSFWSLIYYYNWLVNWRVV